MPRAVFRGLFPVLLVAALAVPGSSPVARAQEAPDRLILAPAGSSTFRVQAVYPNTGVTCESKRKKDLRARFRGRLEIVRQSDGRLALIDHLTFDEYLKGLAEVPRSWPIETLKAQVVAARSYALYQLEHPRASARTLGYDICSTDQCQVYRGLSIEQGAFGDAWIRAVTETRGRVLTHGGSAIQAFYHSTSPGRTRRSFPGGTPLPYLSSVDGQDDDSPLSRWTVRVPFSDLGPILRAAGDWPGGRVDSVRLSGSSVRVAGGGRSVPISKTSFRFDLNDQAPCVYPDRYPTAGSTGNKLPQTVPSIDFSLSSGGGAAVLSGRGWGHGVGMSQYGAKALAERGRGHADILAYFYAGLRPRTVSEPGAIRVLVAENASLVRVGVEGSASVTTATGSALAPGDRFEVRGGDALDVRRGVGPSVTPILTMTLGSTLPLSFPVGGTISVPYTLSGSAKVTLSLKSGITEILRTPEVSQTSGANELSLAPAAATTSPRPSTVSPLPNPSGTSPGVAATPHTSSFVAPDLQPGNYEITLEAYDGLDRVRTSPIALTVQQPPSRRLGRPPPPDSASPTWIYAAIGGVAALAVAGLVLRRRRRRAA
jgi:SpoIID/LytB domain protein/MYXO-CTERM domain-containing protein